jgi:hypothetical protein
MRRGVVGLHFDERSTVTAPVSGVQLGVGQSGPMSLRLFRVSGTRVALAATVLPAQLIAIRAAAAGTPVQVLTARPQIWQPLLRHDSVHVVASREASQSPGGPTLLIDDRPAEARGPAEVRPWQCRIDVRTRWTAADLSVFVHADLTVFGAVPADVIGLVARSFGIPMRSTEPLARLDASSFGVLRRGRIEYVSLNPTSAEGHVLESARGAGPVPAAPRR